MSCGCNCNPCTCSSCDAENEPLASSLNNFITTFFGTPQKSCVNNQVVWTLPCDLATGNPLFPRDSGEGLACYFSRFVETFLSSQQFAVGNKGYESTILTNTDEVLFVNTDFINQDFTGTLTGPVDIFLSSNGAVLGDEFYISFTGLNITAVNNIEILSDAVSLLVIDSPGAVTGYFKAVYTGSAWKLTLTSQNIV